MADTEKQKFGKFARSAKEELKLPRFWILSSVAGFCLLGSSLIDAETFNTYQAMAEDTVANNAQVRWFENPHIYSNFIREIGFASLIALVIIILVERRNHAEQVGATTEMLRVVALDVFKAVLELNSHRAIVQQVVDNVLSSPIIRHDMRLIMTLSPLPPGNEKWNGKYLLLKIDSSYVLENVTRQPVDWDVRVFFPLPAVPELSDMAMIETMSFQDKMLDDAEMSAGDSALDNTDYEKKSLWKRWIEPGEKYRVAATYQLVKEISDNEIWTSLIPTTGIEVTVENRIPNCVWNIDTLHSDQLQPSDAPRTGPYNEQKIRFFSKEALLPYQGVVLWWRPKS